MHLNLAYFVAETALNYECSEGRNRSPYSLASRSKADSSV